MLHSIKALAEDMRRQVKRHRDKRRKRSKTRRLVGRFRDRTA
jgi:ribosome-associated translation inhibitor RaiA